LDKVKDIMQHKLGMNLTNETIEQIEVKDTWGEDYNRTVNAVYILIAVAVISIILAAVVHFKRN